MSRMEPAPRSVAAVDLGSNSFHMVVAQVKEGHVHVVDRLKERVSLAAGLDDDGNLTLAAQRRAMACLARFAQRLRDMPPKNVRAVGTSALRQAKNAGDFLRRAERQLGHAIEVVPGREEARLIYLGVAHSRQDDVGQRLVVDIGGGSTECIIGRGFEPLVTDSLHMGCVEWSLRYFKGGRITKKGMQKARIAARLEVRTIRNRYRRLGWQASIGSSGTILAVEQILVANGWTTQGITRKGLARLRKAMIQAGRADRLELAGMEADRADVLPGGVAILSAIVDGLAIERMATSTGALREGVLFDLLGRFLHEDVRERTIRRFARRYGADPAQAARVERTAAKLLKQVAAAWDLGDDDASRLLAWAARVHEVGLAVAYSGHHRHGAYLVANSDMPGFSRDDQQTLAALILGHRRKLISEMLYALPGPFAERAGRLCVLLRLAVLLHRSRTERRPPSFVVTAAKNRLSVRFLDGWLTRHPLTRADLDEERSFLADAGFELDVR
jgi:exopolyphosphatase / guanosine-5'-triphosphate,3'-diphosphate pyrophosphatase